MVSIGDYKRLVQVTCLELSENTELLRNLNVTTEKTNNSTETNQVNSKPTVLILNFFQIGISEILATIGHNRLAALAHGFPGPDGDKESNQSLKAENEKLRFKVREQQTQLHHLHEKIQRLEQFKLSSSRSNNWKR